MNKKPKSEILKELENNYLEIQNLISKQNFYVGDAEKLLERYLNVLRRMEDLIKSRDNWERKYKELKNEESNLKYSKDKKEAKKCQKMKKNLK